MESQFTVLQGGANAGDNACPAPGTGPASRYDFRQPDCLPKSQVRQLQGLFEAFMRSFDTRVSAYLRFGLSSRVLAVEQRVYSDFLADLHSPTCLFSLGLKPYPAYAIIELTPPLVFPVLEILLGARAGGHVVGGREITEIERNVLDEVLPMILAELRESWKQFTPVEFSLESSDTSPHTLPMLSNEAVVTFTAEVRIGEGRGALNLAVPAIAIKMMKAKYDQLNSTTEPTTAVPIPEKTMDVLKRANVLMDARLGKGGILIRDLLELKPGQVIAFAHPVNKPLDGVINGQQIYKGEIVAVNNRAAFQIGPETPTEE